MRDLPLETVPVTVDGQRFVGRLQRDLGTWGTYTCEQGFHLYLSADQAADPAFLTAHILALKGKRWTPLHPGIPKPR